ncbi:MAG: S-methyl-5-thioribose-1-phosphate isomerase, partial [Pseudobdellovibrionaceae bacterium]|nr:S-methyl-5-thioribose-1-phosphate isomerase [Pseudobdellovibrionaceae bacterium]
MLLCQSLSLRFDDVLGLEILDQTKLPQKEEWIHVTSPQVMLEAIQSLRVRGAPLIGIAASLFWAYWIHKCDCHEADRVYQELRRARPTAINLMNNLDYCYHVFSKNHSPTEVLRVAVDLFFNDVEQCEQMANWGASLMENGDFVLTYCNTGSLATAGIGTALGVIKRSWSLGKRIHVYVCETRPLGQGARLTLWELRKVGIPCTLICDNMVGLLMQKSKINKVIVGAD